MASALLASQNEQYWGERKVYMRKNPNSNPNPSKKQIVDPLDHFHGRQAENSMPGEPGTAVSDDSTSLNRKSISLNHRRESSARGYISFNIAAYSRRELKDLKRRLISELDQVRCLSGRITSREVSGSGYSASQFSGGYAGREVTSATRPPAMTISALDSLTTLSGSDGMKEKRTPKTNQHYRPSEFVIGKEKIPPPESKVTTGSKRTSLFTTPRDSKRPALETGGSKKMLSSVMKRCGEILVKLMKHKHGWIFNVPVDVVGMGLHDYNQIIKHPMDLGTVKSKLGKNLYKNPLEFASDVRLTFNNALVYNPKGHDVHVMAEQLLILFEEMFGPAHGKYEDEQGSVGNDEPRWNSWDQIPTPESTSKPDPTLTSLPPPPSNANPYQNSHSLQNVQPGKHLTSVRSTTAKLPKPKAKDPNKREMSYEEKQKLGLSLQSLPPEKMDQVVQIIRRRNPNLAQQGDEIEVDIEVVDKETLWELDRFVYNCKKMMSKIKRQALAANQAAAEGETVGRNKSPVGEIPEAAKKSKKGDEEDVDIGEEMPSTNFPPVEIEKDAGYASRSSSSSSSSSDLSSSSDSDSGSSSGSDSDADDAQSPFVGQKASPRN